MKRRMAVPSEENESYDKCVQGIADEAPPMSSEAMDAIRYAMTDPIRTDNAGPQNDNRIMK